jgi:hypothetical protein
MRALSPLLLAAMLLLAACGDPEPGDTVVVHHDDGGFTTYKISEQGTRVQHGIEETRLDDGTLFTRAMFVEGEIHGLFERWDTKGRKVEESEFKAGRQQGLSVMWFPDSDTIVRSWYVDDYQQGPYWVTDYAGNVREMDTRIKGHVHGVSLHLGGDPPSVETRVILYGKGVLADDDTPMSEIPRYSR